METRENISKTLLDLGLTPTQAKVYLTLVSLGKANIKKIHEQADLDRSDTYRVIGQLLDLGLIEKIIESPVKYRSMPLKEGLTALLRRKDEEHKQLRADTKILLKENLSLHVPIENCFDQIIVIPPDTLHRNRFQNTLANAQRSLDSIYCLEGIQKTVLEGAYAHKKALKRGIKIRYVIDKAKPLDEIQKIIAPLSRLGDITVRCLPNLPIYFGIIDSKELFVILTPSPQPISSVCLWSNNKPIIDVFQTYFDLAFQKSA